MFFRRPPPTDVEPAHLALAQGHYEAAFALLESAAKRQKSRGAQAQLLLYLAAIHTLYGRDGVDAGLGCLREASRQDPDLAQRPLYRALYWEFCAHRGDLAADVRRGALAATDPSDAFAAYHAANALMTVGASDDALEMLRETSPEQLPSYLVWRYWSLLGQAYEFGHHWLQAAEAFEQAASLATGSDQQEELLNLAACWLEAARPQDAQSALAAIDDTLLQDRSAHAFRTYLEGRAELALGNPTLALERFLAARTLEDAADAPSHTVALALAQTFHSLGQDAPALTLYQQAAQLAPETERASVLHEYAIALLDRDRLIDARDVLQLVGHDPSYPHRAEAYADLADLEYRLGHLQRADELARRALDLGSVGPACLCLGMIAYEYFRFDEAQDWFEQAASDSHEGDADWLLAQEMLTEIRAQDGYRDPAAVIRHAQTALRHLSPSDERARVMTGHIEHARTLLGGHSRLLN